MKIKDVVSVRNSNINIHFVQHENFEAPGAILDWANERKHSSTFSKVYENDPLPELVDEIDLLIVMGGPQSPNTTKDECLYFDAHGEIALIQKCIVAQKAVLGVCLGAQLIGEALHAKFEHSPEKEIGVFPIRLTEIGLKDENIAHFDTSILVGHWHNDMPGLTTDSKILATSIGCPRQIVSYSDLVYGFQCHMELTQDLITLLIAEEEEFLKTNTTYRFVQTPNEIRKHDFSMMNQYLFKFLDNLVKTYQQTCKTLVL